MTGSSRAGSVWISFKFDFSKANGNPVLPKKLYAGSRKSELI